MIIDKVDRYWHKLCILDAMRINRISDIETSIDTIYEAVPFGLILKALQLENAMPICEWVIKDYFKSEYTFIVRDT